MATIQQTYIYALLADATYADNLTDGDFGTTLEGRLSLRMTPTLAKFIGDNFEVVSHVESGDGVGSGFDATAWRGRAGTPYAGQLYVSMQGTSGLADFLADADLAASGAARQQFVEMVNWWLRISTARGEPAPQIELGNNAVGPNGLLQYFRFAAPSAGTGQLIAASNINVVGHSLGGHLASAFARIFGGSTTISQVSTFNSAGFLSASEPVFNQLQGLLGMGTTGFTTAQNNYFAENGINVTTNTFWFNQIGTRVRLFNEEGTGFPNHFMYKLTDALALAVVLERLDATFGFVKASNLFNAGSNRSDASLEVIVDSLRRLLLDPATGNIPVGDADKSAASRVTYHETLKLLQDSPAFASLAGKVQITPVGANLATQAKARVDFQSLAALHTLAPFVLDPAGASGQAALTALWQSAAWNTTYQDWLADKTMPVADQKAGKQTFTDRWIDDRAAMLSNILNRNQKDIASGLLLQGVSNTDYVDVSSGQSISVRRGVPASGTPVGQAFFGGSGADERSGQGIADHLYGGAGNDTLNGLAGNDWLEGNADNDTLNGGDGTDTLLGGTGNDTLDGGTGNDFLKGGKDTDTYTFSANWGHDIIDDADGLGTINVAGLGAINGTGATKVAPDTWQTADAQVNYSLVNVDATRNDLYISFSDRADAITLRNWNNGQLGITLPGSIASAAPPPTDQTITLFDPPGPAGAYADLSGSTLSYLIYGTPDGDQIFGGFGNEQIVGNGGGDRVYGNDGDDRIYAAAIIDIESAIAAAQTAQVASVGTVLEGGRGDDLLIGGASNWLHGGAGRDTLIGGGAVDWVQGDTFNAGFAQPGVSVTPNFHYDPVKHKYTYYVSRVEAGATGYYARLGQLDLDGAGDTIVTGAGDDVADGELGDDTLLLGEGIDIGVGGSGDDTLQGGAGNDLLFGDLNGDASTPTGNEPIQLQLNYAGLAGGLHGDDLLQGGDGDDLIWGNGGSDQLYGGSGADRLLGDDGITPGQFHGEDFLDGGADDDELEGGDDDDALFGGAGDDRLWGDFGQTNTAMLAYQGKDYLDGEVGNDQLVGGGSDDTLIGGSGDDNLWGDDVQSNLAVSAHGNDEIDGGDGNDLMVGGGGNDKMEGGAGNDQLQGDDLGINVDIAAHGMDLLDGGAGDDTLIGGGNDDNLFGGAGNDFVRGDDLVVNVAAAAHGADWLEGGAGDDTLLGDGGNDTLIGGTGTDYLAGGSGNDRYVFELGDSPLDAQGFTEVIVDTEGTNTVSFGSGIDAAAMQFAAVGGGQYLQINYSASDFLLVANGVGGAVQNYQFSDGTTQNLPQLIGRSASAPVLGYDASGAFSALGGRNNDSIASTAGFATLSGGGGNDTIVATGGGNRYLFNPGDGRDTITDLGGVDPNTGAPMPASRIQFGAGITQSDITLTNDGALVLNIGADANNGVRLTGFNASNALAATGIDRFVFFDGAELTHAQLLARGFDFAGTAGADVLNGTNLQDRFAASAGNDTMRGGAGSDNYAWGLGSGQDLIDELDTAVASVDVLNIGAGLNAGDLALNRSGNDLLVKVRTTTDTIRVVNHFTGAGIEQMRFADGTLWTTTDIAAHLTNDLTEGPDNFTGSPGDDLIFGRGGDDIIDGAGGNDTIDGGTGIDTLRGGPGNDVIDGGDGDYADYLYGDDGDDTLRGGAGADDLSGGNGNDRLDGGAGDDLLNGLGGSNTYVFGIGYGHDRIVSNLEPGVSQVLEFASGTTLQDMSVTRNQLDLVITTIATAESLTYSQFFWSDPEVRGDFLKFAGGSILDAAGIKALVLVGNETDQVLQGYAGNDTIDAAGGHDSVYGYGGNDTLLGGTGNDALDGGAGDDWVSGGVGNDTVSGYLGNDRLDGGAGDDVLAGGSGNDTYVFGIGSGHDTIADQDPGDTVAVQAGVSPADVTITRNGFNMTFDIVASGDALTVQNFFLADAAPIPPAEDYRLGQVTFSDGTTWDAAAMKLLALAGTEAAQVLTGYATGDTIFAAGGADFVYGEGGDDTLGGGLGDDQLYGGVGNDTLRGDAGNDRLYGDDGNDLLDGGAGNDVLSGGDGSDTYTFGVGAGNDNLDNFDTSVGRIDTVAVGAGLVLSDLDIRNVFGSLQITIKATGDSITVTGFFVGVLYEINFLKLADGTSIDSTGLKALAAAAPDLPLTLTGTAGPDTLVGAGADDVLNGMAGNDSLTGKAGNDLLDGGTGADMMTGGTGNDTYVVDNNADVTFENVNEGDDFIQSSITWSLGANIERLTLTGTSAINGTGNALANVLTGNGAGNTLNGSTGADVMVGGAGNDTYVVDNAGDLVMEALGEGTDLVQSSVTYALGADLENLTLTGSGAINVAGNTLDNVLTGNSANNTLTGGAGNDTLDGGLGNDTMVGGTGNDTYIVNVASDVVTELANEGTDTVQSSATLTLAANVENLVLTGTAAINATGNALDNVLAGNSAANILTGGAGNDTYVVGTGDTVTEAASAGTDTVLSAVTSTLGTNLENLTLTGTAAVNATGNTQNNVITGNSAANTLNGGTGADTMLGGAGNDTYVVDNVADVVTEAAGEGTDLVQSGVTYTLAANVERLTLTGTTAISGTGNTLDNLLTGNSANNTLTGGAGNDTIDGGTGNDTMVGGAGNDVYVVNIATDIVTELATEGTDTVQSAVTLTLGNNVENLTLTGTTAINGMGNALDNVLAGNSANNTLTGAAGNDTLDGGLGNDTMLGGLGNDTFVVNVSTDTVTENANEGTDTVQSAVAWTLGNNLENLTLTGTSAINGTGNTLNNVLLGNIGANTLTGGAGDDTYDGAAGNDVYSDTSTTSNDTYRFGIGSGLDTLTDAGGTLDHVDLFAGITAAQLRFTRNVNNLELTITGAADKLTINGWYASTANRIEEFRLGDGSVVLASQMQSLVSAMAAFSPAGAGAFDTGGRMFVQPIRPGVELVAGALQ